MTTKPWTLYRKLELGDFGDSNGSRRIIFTDWYTHYAYSLWKRFDIIFSNYWYEIIFNKLSFRLHHPFIYEMQTWSTKISMNRQHIVKIWHRWHSLNSFSLFAHTTKVLLHMFTWNWENLWVNQELPELICTVPLNRDALPRT